MASLISIGQIFDASLDHYRKYFKELLAISLWFVVASVPTLVAQLLEPFGGSEGNVTATDWVTFALFLVGAILVLVASLWTYATLILAVDSQAKNKKVTFKQIMAQGWKKFWPYLLLSILGGLIFLGLALLIAPGLALIAISVAQDNAGAYANLGVPLFFIGGIAGAILIAKYGVELAFSPYVLLLENKGPVPSLKTSQGLVKGRWWATLLRFVLPKLVYLMIAFLVSIVVSIAFNVLMSLVATSVGAVLLIFGIKLLATVCISAVITPVFAITDYYLYDSLKQTK